MLPWIKIDAAVVPGTRKTIRLMRRGDEFSIFLDADLLMGSRMRGSEEALARLGCADLATRNDARVLIGGLGMGFTLAAALAVLPPRAELVVAELVPAVIAWARGPLAGFFAGLADPRVRLHEGDVGEAIRAGPAAFDAILLDVDNGPEGMTQADNDALYSSHGVAEAWTALRPGGVFAVWSATADAAFTQRLARTGFRVEEAKVRATGKRGARHLIWVARRPLGIERQTRPAGADRPRPRAPVGRR